MCNKVEIISSINQINKELDRILILKDPRLFNKILKQLQDALLNAYNGQREVAVKDAIYYLTSLDKENFSETDIKKIDKIISDKLGMKLNQLIEKEIQEVSEKAFKLGVKDILKPLSMKLSFDVNDEKAMEILSKQNLFWVGRFYGDQVSEKFNNALTGYFNSDKTIQEVSDILQSDFYKVSDKGVDYFKSLAEYSVNRTRNLGSVSGFEKAGITEYEIQGVVDDRTCALCLSMQGRRFQVQSAISFRDKILDLKSPDDIKTLAPWLKPADVEGVETSDLPDHMCMPLYHFNCRDQMAPVFN